MKRNIFLRVALFLLIGVWASGSLLTGTWAKYTASATVSASARVAKFSVKVNSKEIADAADVMTINVPVSLVDTVLAQPDKLGSGVWDSANGGNHSTTMIDKVDGSIIAPGTGGRIKVVFENYSEVAVRFSFDTATCTATGTGTPQLMIATTNPSAATGATSNPGCEIQFSRPTGTGGTNSLTPTLGQWGTLAYTLTYGGFYTTDAALTLPPYSGSGAVPSATRYFFWRWRFNDANNGADWNRDSDDTALGKQGTAELKLTLVFKAEQVD